MNNFSCDNYHLNEFFIRYDASQQNLQVMRADDEN